MDIDIDLPTDFDPHKYFKVVNASSIENDELKKHPVGVYFQNIPEDPITGLAAIPSKQAEHLGYVKVDMLHLSMLNNFKSKEEVRSLTEKEPNWKLLEDSENVSKLFQIGKHFDIVDKIRPKSVLELADVIAFIRPGKKILLDKYMRNRNLCRKELYTKRNIGDYRKSHAIAYALAIVIQLHYMETEQNYDPFE
jgi:hypothetical protein